jgi:hypothetical protein
MKLRRESAVIGARSSRLHEKKPTHPTSLSANIWSLSTARVFLSSAALLGYTKIALALLLRVIFFKNHSRRLYAG